MLVQNIARFILDYFPASVSENPRPCLFLQSLLEPHRLKQVSRSEARTSSAKNKRFWSQLYWDLAVEELLRNLQEGHLDEVDENGVRVVLFCVTSPILVAFL